MEVYHLQIEILENTFFASREINNYYETEPLLGHFALAYGLGLCNSGYSPTKKPLYQDHFSQLNEKGIYLTPATIRGKPDFIIQNFNTLTDSYWYAFRNNAVESDRNKTRTYASNFPQQGKAKMLAVGNKFDAYLLTEKKCKLPTYFRMGKFMSKAKLNQNRVKYSLKQVEKKQVPLVLSPLDLPDEVELHSYDVINIRPTPLIKNSVISGQFYYISQQDVYLPVHMSYEV